MSRNDVWMPLYLGDYLADTMHLNAAEHGAYLLLLMHYWRTGPLPDNDAQLAIIAKTESRAWRTVGPVVRAFFSPHAGTLRQKRMDAERTKADIISAERRDAGKKGGDTRWANSKRHSKPIANAIANGIANACQTAWQTDTQSQSHKESSLSEESLPRARDLSEPPGTGFIGQEVATEMLAKVRKAMKPTAYPPGRSATLTRDEQIAAVAPAPVKPAHLTPEQLAIARRKHA